MIIQNNQILRLSSDRSLVGWWPLEGGTAFDRSGNGWNGTIVNGPVPCNSLIGNDAFIFDRTASQYIDVDPSHTGLGLGAVNSNLTTTGWFKQRASGDSGAFFKLGNTGPGGGGFAIGLGASSLESSGNNLLGLFEFAAWIHSGFVITTGVWTHFAFVVGQSPSPLVSFYINGVLVYSAQITTPAAVGTGSGTTLAQIGGYVGSSSENRYFTGSLSNIRLHREALGAKDIRQLYEYTPNPTTALRYIPLNTVISTDVVLSGLSTTVARGITQPTIDKTNPSIASELVSGAFLPNIALTTSGQNNTLTLGTFTKILDLNLAGSLSTLANQPINISIAKDVSGTTVSMVSNIVYLTISKELVGNNTTTAYSTLSKEIVKALTGNLLSCSNGLLLASKVATLLGNSLSITPGTLSVVFDKALTGISSSLINGNLTVQVGGDISIVLSGFSVSIAQQVLIGSIQTYLSGLQSSTVNANLVGTIGKTLAGSLISSTQGSLLADSVKALVGQSITATYGTITYTDGSTANVTLNLTGTALQALQNTLIPSVNLTSNGIGLLLEAATFTAELSKILSTHGVSSDLGNLDIAVTLSIAGQTISITKGNVISGSNNFVQAIANWEILIHASDNNLLVIPSKLN